MSFATDIKKAAKLAKVNKTDYIVYDTPTYNGITIFDASKKQPIEGWDFPHNSSITEVEILYFGNDKPTENWITDTGAKEILKGIWQVERYY